MDDERKKSQRRGDGKPAGARGPRKPGFGGKPRAGAGKPHAGGDKPFRKRASEGPAAAGAGDRPKRDNWRDKGGERADAGKPFRKGPPRDGERKPYGKRAGFEGKKSFGPRGDGERKPPSEHGAGRPDRPFVKGGRDGDDRPRKPYVPRERGGEERQRQEFRRERPAGEGHGFKRDFRPRDRDGEGRTFTPRERDGEGRPPREGARSSGLKSHDGQRRSYGIKSHDDRPKRDGERNRFGKPVEPAEDATGERIAKRLARAGIASRRDAEALIAAGRVTVNGRKLESPAFNVSVEDRIEVDGMAIPAIERTRLFLFHKPSGVVTTNRDPEGRKTVFDVLPADLPRLMTVGRLDINTEGLLLLTNDGGLARVLELPATGWLRRYRVRVHGKVEEKALAALKDGIAVDGVFYGSIEASLDREQGSNAWLTIGLREGKNREVKNILGALGLDVTRLIRISYGPFQLGELPEGHVLEIKGRMLRDQLGERLIEESGANFEAPVVSQFPNQPVRREAPRNQPLDRPKAKRDAERAPVGEGGLIKKRHRREETRREALDKLSTRPDRSEFRQKERPQRPLLERGERPERSDKFGARPDRFASFGDKDGDKPARTGKREREHRPIDPPGQRKANVWMAPGARPIGAGRAAAEQAAVESKRAAKKPFGAGARPAQRKPRAGERPHGSRSGPGKGGPAGGKGRG